MLLQTFSSVANFPNDDPHWEGELPGAQASLQTVFKGHDVAFLCGSRRLCQRAGDLSNHPWAQALTFSHGLIEAPSRQRDEPWLTK